MLRICTVFAAALIVSHATAADNLLANPDFRHGLDAWTAETGAAASGTVTREGGPAARIAAPEGARDSYPRYFQEVPTAPGDLLELAAEAAVEGADGGYGAYCTLEYLDAGGRRIAFDQSSPAARGGRFDALLARGVAPEGAARARACLVLNGRGEAFFRNAALRRLGSANAAPPEGPVTLTVTSDLAVPALWGFGAEDDGWHYNAENAARGVDDADHALREARIEAMDPDWVRMFFWCKDWNPSGDWTAFDWDTDNMRSHYRALDVYQRIGAAVTVTGVEWFVEDAFEKPEPMAAAIGALLEHLVKARGYTCVKHWQLTNEPNTFWSRNGRSFDDYARLHALVHAEIARRGLDVAILGSDDTNHGWPWFKQCVEHDEYYARCAAFASHHYARTHALALGGPFFQERIDRLRARAAGAPPKPFLVAEFGFQDGRAEGPLHNPVAESFDYALWTMDFILDGLDRGAAGFNLWCLHETYYPNDWRMEYGLWHYKDRAWALRPAFHAAALFTRFTEPGDPVHRVRSSHPAHLRAVRIGPRLLWVNLHTAPLATAIEGFAPTRLAAYTESALPADTALPPAQPVPADGVVLPARSFGGLE